MATTTGTGPIASRRAMRMFDSYAHTDLALADRLLRPLRSHLEVSKSFAWQCWHDDGQIAIGQDWHARIQQGLTECDCGLALVSPAFLGSKYIQHHELSRLLSGGKPILPVGLAMLDFDMHDLKGLQTRQIFQLATGPNGDLRSFSELTSGQQRERFVFELFRQIERRMR